MKITDKSLLIACFFRLQFQRCVSSMWVLIINPDRLNGLCTSVVDPQGLDEQNNIIYPFAAMRKPVGALRVVSNEFLHETHGRPCGDAGSATVLETIQFTASILTRFVLRTWSSLPPRGTFEPRNPFRIGRCNEDASVNVTEREGTRIPRFH